MANSSHARSISSGIVRIMKDFTDLGRMVDEILGPSFPDVLSLYKPIVALHENQSFCYNEIISHSLSSRPDLIATTISTLLSSYHASDKRD
jgi:hypothetical protein